jgi:CDP-diacylglycerol--serine O-phosphatidyltransferase
MDSLSDLVTFGVAPMVLLMAYYDVTWVSVVAVLLPLFGALRLARHNINRHQTKGYLIGLPITSAGVIIPLVILWQCSSALAGTITALLALAFLSTRRVNKLLK